MLGYDRTDRVESRGEFAIRGGIVDVFPAESRDQIQIMLAGSLQGVISQRLVKTTDGRSRVPAIEVMVGGLTVLAESDALPFAVSDKAMVAGAPSTSADNVAEDLRLQYRYLDLRRPSIRDNLILRHRIFQCVRQFLDSRGFLEIETPVLTVSTPEGARDYLVPSRVHPRSFYALPQSPQIFKQLLMIGGMERYFQLARCFRDEDLRPNRQPEFTQLDIEASFIDEEFFYELIEELAVKMFAIGGIALRRPFPRMTYAEAMERLLTDPEHRRTLGENGRRLVEERFTPEAVGAQLRSVLEGR